MSKIDVEPAWKNLRLSLERPYKDDSGHRIPVLYDLTPEGERIYEPKQTPSARLEANLLRIFSERGSDFFDRRDGLLLDDNQKPANGESGEETAAGDRECTPKTMTMKELHAMRSEIISQLFIALGEMSQARDLLSALLSGMLSSQSQVESLPSLLSATLVTKPPPITSVQAFNAQLTIGSKDEALRKAAALFKSASESMERSRLRGELYWVDALKIRRANWSLTPAPLPPGSATGKGADKTSKDFLISYGLEGSPPFFRRRAIATIPTLTDSSRELVFPLRQNTRLRIAIATVADYGKKFFSFLSPRPSSDATDPETSLIIAQTEVMDQEIFSLLVKEAGQLPTASARVSERLIAIDAAQGLELTFELVEYFTDQTESKVEENMCELIYHVLHVLLLRQQKGARRERGGESNRHFDTQSMLLQPIIDALQYQVFCERVEAELHRTVDALNAVGIPSSLSFTAVTESGQKLVSIVSDESTKALGGEAVIRVDSWRVMWFTFVSPSTLTAHLSQATLTISSLSQLCQLLMDEMERFLLQRICAIGQDLCQSLGGIWFIDLNRCVAKWEGCVLNFHISYGLDLSIQCSAFKVDATTGKQGQTQTYVNGTVPLMTWIQRIIQQSSHRP
ncbi:subunit 17 of mediator complex-domain-containing protein [Gymnopilus junonius]|uniref:Mediator of RNA polymerase II transcription subunit 17 n=1 Tax=Gymnopilus junonius TaxID=109634 RepID=A0A9P5P1N3_GYMJU|nr:subunit 17 of mediator complex-domain-containing protein [Gymnopilus junonius]